MNKKPKVFFVNLRSDSQRNLFDKLDELMERTGLDNMFSKGQLVGIKLHFGELGNTAHIRPQFVRRVVERVKETGARPFLTDTNTLYVGERTNSVSHTECALRNGFGHEVTGAPIIIADGLRGESADRVEVNGKRLKDVSIAREILSASGLVVMSHFKCHELTGFGGALKNLGMGCASREGKLEEHSGAPPVIEASECTACGECVPICPSDAIEMGNVALIINESCTGCSHCIAACPEGAIKIKWGADAAAVQEKMMEYVKGALKGKEDKVLYINFINQVSPSCDCYGHTDSPIVPDIGILASTDPVAIDKASVDMVNAREGFKESALKSGHEAGGDKFRGVHPDIDWTVQFDYAEEIGFGSADYELEEL